MKSVRCIVVDDEVLGRKLLENFIKKIDSLELVALCKSPIEAMNVLGEEHIDLMFLDIQMPQITGINFLKSLIHRPLVIFTTAYKQYAIEGYSLDIIDYLLKPFSFERFLQAINRAKNQLQLMQQQSSKILHTKAKREANPKDYILIKTEHKIVRLKCDTITHIEGMRAYLAFHTDEKQRILSLNTLKKIETELPKHRFLRVHKSYIVAVDKVEAIAGNQLIIGELKIPVGASYKTKVMEILFK
ncbi:MAG: response regulator transcription factor [Saprospiraceae bacterium]|nr:response regulator transcription factor [Saprospiraceae bacterium]